MKGRVRQGHYEVKVKVYDVIWKHEVVSTVTVVVKEIDDVAIANAGSLRIQGGICVLSFNLLNVLVVPVTQLRNSVKYCIYLPRNFISLSIYISRSRLLACCRQSLGLQTFSIWVFLEP